MFLKESFFLYAILLVGESAPILFKFAFECGLVSALFSPAARKQPVQLIIFKFSLTKNCN